MIVAALNAWTLARLRARHARHKRAAERWHREARRLALEAYNVPDMMVEPLRWGRLQNSANWAKHYARNHHDAALRCEIKIDELEKNK